MSEQTIQRLKQEEILLGCILGFGAELEDSFLLVASQIDIKDCLKMYILSFKLKSELL